MAKAAAGCLDDHDAEVVRLPPTMHQLAKRTVRVFLFSNLGNPEAEMLAELSWAAGDILEKILDESSMLLFDAA